MKYVMLLKKQKLILILADFEIFDIVDALEKAEGKDTNFYNWLGVAVSWFLFYIIFKM